MVALIDAVVRAVDANQPTNAETTYSNWMDTSLLEALHLERVVTLFFSSLRGVSGGLLV